MDSAGLTELAAGAAVVTVVFIFVGYLSKRDDKLADALERVASSNEEGARQTKTVAKAIVKQADEAEKRNGHLADHTTEIAKLVTEGNRLTGRIVERLEKTAVIAADDREILTGKVEGK